jgi:hypothetical protein
MYAYRELLLLEGVSLQGHGNWQAISEHVGTRTKEEVEQHYNAIYVDSPDWPLPVSSISSQPRITLIKKLTLSGWMSNLILTPVNSKNANVDEYHQ